MKLKQTAIASVIGGALAMMSGTPASALPLPPKPFAPALAAVALPVAADAASDIAELQTKLGEANKKLADANKEIKRLADLLEGVKDQPLLPGAVAEIKGLKDRVYLLEKQVDDMKKSTSFKPALPAPLPADPMTGKGTVRVVNEYPVEITLVVNNASYRVAPNTKLDITVPMGDFTYLLLNAGATLAPIKSPIKEKEVVTLRIK